MPLFDDPEVYRAILEGMQTGVYVVDRLGKILLWNAGAERITGYLRQDMLGRQATDDFLGYLDTENNALAGEMSPVAKTFRDGKPQEAEISLQHKSSHRVPVRLRTVPVRNALGAIVGVAECFDESMQVADWGRRQSKLATYGCLDEASGVMNHGMVQSHLREAISMFAEHPIPFSVLSIGVDELESHKTRQGPGAVAHILHVVGQTLEHSLRPTDFLGRWNENEFLAVIRECGAGESGRVCERLRKMVRSAKVEWWGDTLTVSVSMGATSVKEGDTVELIVERAETALRESSKQGGSRVIVA